VYKARDITDNSIVAMKKIPLIDIDEGVPSTAIREIALLKDLSHESIVELFDVIYSENKLFLVFAFLEQDLKQFMDRLIRRREYMEPSLVKSFMRQMLSGVGFCHENRVLHRDLKPQNILLDSNFNIKIADFGLARTFSVLHPTYTNEVVTLWYRSPEILMGSSEYSTALDVWSIGCTFAEMMKLIPMFGGDCEIDQLYKIFRHCGTPTEQDWPNFTKYKNFSHTFPKWPRKNMRKYLTSQLHYPGLTIDDDAVDLLDNILICDPLKRMNCRDALNHPYFSDDE
jgi:serine/threonine protein kinase